MKKVVIHLWEGEDNPRGCDVSLGDSGIMMSTRHCRLEKDTAGNCRLVVEFQGEHGLAEDLSRHAHMLPLLVPSQHMREQLLALSERVSLVEAKLAK